MRWWPKPAEQVIRIRIDGEPVKDFNVDHWLGMAMMFQRVPGLQDSLLLDFKDTMAALEKLPADAHGERLKISQKAVDLWRFLQIPVRAVDAVNAIKEDQRKEQQEPAAPLPSGPQTVM